MMNDGDAESDEEAGPATRTGSDPPEREDPEARDGDERGPGRVAGERGSSGASPPDPDPDSDSGVGAGSEDGNGGPVRGEPVEEGPGVADVPGEETGVSPEEVDVEELTGPVRKLDPKVRYVWVLGSVMGSLVLGGIAGVVGFVALDRPLLGVAVFLFLLALGAVLAVLRYRSWSYEVREDSLYLERGVITHTRTVVPYVRIQHVDASRGPVERALGLATAVVYTAGSRGADVSIPGLTTGRADDLQERLKRLAIAAEGEDAV
jgi:hypothetical protein